VCVCMCVPALKKLESDKKKSKYELQHSNMKYSLMGLPCTGLGYSWT